MSHPPSTAVQALFQKGFSLHQQGQLKQAQALYLEIVASEPYHFDALQLLGAIALQTGDFHQAIEWLNKAIAIEPHNAIPYYNRGFGLQALKQHQAAIESYDRAIALKPNYVEAYGNRGDLFRELKQYQAAIESYNYALALRPHYPFLQGMRIHTKAYLCDWKNFHVDMQKLTQSIERNEKTILSFPFLALNDSLSLQRKVAEISIHNAYPFNPELGDIPPRKPHNKIRIAYFSADFHNHATTYLMAELFEHHYWKNFELIAFSFGPDENDAMRQRLLMAFDQFIDVRHKTDKEIAQLSRTMGIDIAIDLKGFTSDNRFGIFAYRAAPIQVSYIGYPGTVGADYMDYIIADKTLIPESAQPFYSEKIVYLPHTYQVNDRKREISDKVFTREELGLPKTGFVFCCFNQNYKITPTTFDGWMRILQQVPDSVLWLVEDHPTAAHNLRKEAKRRGIDSKRLVFATRMPLPEHLARHAMADLFIDTLPYNAHTTASDALWAGLPVLTCMGESFASRVAGSLLNAIELPELITKTQSEFEARAVELALNPEKLQIIRDKLAKNRLTTPLFDSKLFTRHLENAYEQMMQRYHAGLPPAHITVNPTSEHIENKKPANAGLGRYFPPFLSRFLPRSQ